MTDRNPHDRTTAWDVVTVLLGGVGVFVILTCAFMVALIVQDYMDPDPPPPETTTRACVTYYDATGWQVGVRCWDT